MPYQDTICAVSTPIGAGGIGIIRISGRDALAAISKIFRPQKKGDVRSQASHTIQYGHILDPLSGRIVDEVLLSVMRAPASYTREDVVEINCHGGVEPLLRTLRLLIASGARQAEPGEFTRRAFLNGRIDLAQAEAVMDVIRAKTEGSLRAANEQLCGELSRSVGSLRQRLIGILAGVEAGLDFAEEEIEQPSGASLEHELNGLLEEITALIAGASYGRIVRDGFSAVIVGRPNVGKSSLLNALLKQDRAIVTEVPGTTRDAIEEYLNICGVAMKIIDTAGIRETHDMVEREGVRRSLSAIEQADIIIVVFDGSERLHEGDQRVLKEIRQKQVVAAINKADLDRRLEHMEWPEIQVALSCRTGAGLGQLESTIAECVRSGAVPPREHAWVINERHRDALERAKGSLEKAKSTSGQGLSPEFIALDLRDALDSIGTIIGATYTDDILERIFRDFCIGK